METFITILDWVGRITTLLFIAALLWGFYAWFKGILPAIIRLGMGLAKRKIAIYAKGDNFSSLKDLLVDSKLFNEKNIIQISKEGDMAKGEQATLFLVYWPDWKNTLEKILGYKNDSVGFIVYAPQSEGFIPPNQMNTLNNHRNTIVTNFRGRLLNDIVVSLITTSYEQ